MEFRTLIARVVLVCVAAAGSPALALVDIPTSNRRALSVAELASSSGVARPADTAVLPLDNRSYLQAYRPLEDRGLVDLTGQRLEEIAAGREPGRLLWETLVPQVELRTYPFGSDGGQRVLYHSNGDVLYDGFNAFLTADGTTSYSTWLGVGYELKLQRRPSDFTYRTERLYTKAVWGKWSFKVGRDAERLGVGYHGSLLLDDNAPTMDLWRIRTEEPLFFPGALSVVGGFRFTLFNAYLSDDNPRPADLRYGSGVDTVSDPNLLGMRLSYHPTSWLDFGVNRTILYGGNGRESYDTPRDWWELFSGVNENVEAGGDHRYDNDQYASLDVVLRLPFLNGLGPFRGGKVYWEYAGTDVISKWQGEDTGGIEPFKFNQVANLGGVYFSTAVTDFRFEYADTSQPWYRHNQYPQGFTYRGIPLGHHMGGDARNWFVEIGRYFGPRWRATAGLDLEERGRSLPQEEAEERSEFSFGLEALEITAFGVPLQGELDLLFADVDNPLDDPDREDRSEIYVGLCVGVNLKSLVKSGP